MAGVALASATVTAKSGPATQVTAQVLSGISSMSIDFKRAIIQIYQGNELTGPAKEFDLVGVTTFTINASTLAIVIS